MQLLFIQGGSRWKYDTNGNVYTETNFNDSIWRRYSAYCDKLVVILRKEEKIYPATEAKSKFNVFNTELADHIALPDLYMPKRNAINPFIRREIQNRIEQEIKKADRVIIRSLGNIYTNTALKMAKKYSIPYLVEVTGFTFEGMWYHSLRGKFVSFWKEYQYRRLISDAPYAVYVTQSELQKRYPTIGKSIGCSDVEITDLKYDVLEKRLARINQMSSCLIIGTAGFLDVKYKGQASVIKAIASLKKQGIENIQYRLIGAGSGTKLKKLASDLGVSSQVIIEGTLPHSQVFNWYDSIDVYIHPGYIEGLCRSIVEAMSRALPVTCAAVGGNVELAEPEMLFNRGNTKDIEKIIKRLMDSSLLSRQARISFEKAREYSKDELDRKRDSFYRSFIGD